MKQILFLAHRLPYPPDKGDKIRSFHVLRQLSKFFRLHVAAFIDDENDWQHVRKISDLCDQTCFVPLDKKTALLRSLKGLLNGQALTLPYYFDPLMQAFVDKLLAENAIDLALSYSSSMAPYILGKHEIKRVMDFVDVDSQKWLAYSQKKQGLMRWVYQREAHALLGFEKKIAASFDLSFFVSDAETALFKRLAPEVSKNSITLENGVDTDYFDAGIHHPPYQADIEAWVFTGALDYWANVDAVSWFASEIWPAFFNDRPNARFYIVGSKPSPEVIKLKRLPGIVVTGAVADVRPYLSHARCAVVPLRIARGIQNKVLEAMAMAKPVVLSAAAAEGLSIDASLDLKVADTPKEWLSLMTSTDFPKQSLNNRAFVRQNYSWECNLSLLPDLLQAL